jgi:hypothetical protein
MSNGFMMTDAVRDAADRVVADTMLRELATALRTKGANLTIELPTGLAGIQIRSEDLLSVVAECLVPTPPCDREASKILDRADEYLSSISNRSDSGPHHLVSDLAAALPAGVPAPPPAPPAPVRRSLCPTPPEDLWRLASAIDKARNSYLNQIGEPGQAEARAELERILWNDEGTFGPAIRLAALTETEARADIASRMNGAASVAQMIEPPATSSEEFERGWHAFRDTIVALLDQGEARLESPSAVNMRNHSIALSVRETTLEEAAIDLAESYPDNANTAAFCAAIRSLKSSYRSNEGVGWLVRPMLEEIVAIGRRITDPNNVLGTQMCNIATKAMEVIGEARRWRHKKRGGSYVEVLRARLQAAQELREGDTIVVYIADVDGTCWGRKDTEFEDGPFEEITVS